MVSYHFNIEEVEELLPEVAILMEEAIAVQLELKEAYLKTVPVDSNEEIDEKLLTNDIPENPPISIVSYNSPFAVKAPVNEAINEFQLG